MRAPYFSYGWWPYASFLAFAANAMATKTTPARKSLLDMFILHTFLFSLLQLPPFGPSFCEPVENSHYDRTRHAFASCGIK